MAEEHRRMGFNRKPPIWSSGDPIGTHPCLFGEHARLSLPIAHVFYNGIRKHEVDTLLAEWQGRGVTAHERPWTRSAVVGVVAGSDNPRKTGHAILDKTITWLVGVPGTAA